MMKQGQGECFQLHLVGEASSCRPSASRHFRTHDDEALEGPIAASLTSCTRRWGVRRFRRNNCCGRCLLQFLYSIRSERLLMEQIDYNMLFRWFVGLNMDDAVWDATVFTQEPRSVPGRRYRPEFLGARRWSWRGAQGLTSDEHFTVDGTLFEAWASQKSFKRKDGSTTTDRVVDRAIRASISAARSVATTRMQSTTDPEARLYRKGHGQEAKLSLPRPCADREPQRAWRWAAS